MNTLNEEALGPLCLERRPGPVRQTREVLTPMAQAILSAMERANQAFKEGSPIEEIQVSLPQGSKQDLCVALATASKEYSRRYPGSLQRWSKSRRKGRDLAFSKGVTAILGLSGRTTRRLIKTGRDILKGCYQQPKRKLRPAVNVLQEHEIRELENVWGSTDEELTAARKELEGAKKELETLQDTVRQQASFIECLRAALDGSRCSGSPVGEKTQELLRTALTGPETPADCLRLLAAAYPDRVVVLESASASAEESEGFKHIGKLSSLLERLATKYYEAMTEGKGDAEAYTYMGWGYAAKDNVSGNAQVRRAHTFHYNGRDILMEKHLRIGVKASTAETIRVHFEWLADERKLVIGWCGKHLC